MASGKVNTRLSTATCNLQPAPKQHELNIYIRARYPLLWIVTSEEERALAKLKRWQEERKNGCSFEWLSGDQPGTGWAD